MSYSEDTKPASEDMPVEITIEHAKRAFALKKYEEAVSFYATALQTFTLQFGEEAPETADLYFSYGKALLENAISQSSVLGKDQPEEQGEDGGTKASGNNPVLSFTGDELLEDTSVDLFGQAAAEPEGPSDDEDEGDADGEPEDDFNAAWEVFEISRGIYLKQRETDGDDELGLKLADTYIALGDVSLETEKFDQAISDYEAGLELKTQLLPFSSRQIAEAHYKLSIVLDLTSGRLADSIVHAGKALESIEARLVELEAASANPSLQQDVVETKPDPKGKGKAKASKLVGADSVAQMSPAQIDGEIKELMGLKEDLALKIEELKTSPNDAITSNAAAMAAQALDRELNAAASAQTMVNDLTSIVKKKKKAPEASGAPKRKADDDGEVTVSEKKAKIESPPPS
ncbi:hypothetical protein C8J56DRAFT_1007368 [Mycena floridula]|nr:hypothetical protein C8J56DRAFT_1007368 [Mycena floridula]